MRFPLYFIEQIKCRKYTTDSNKGRKGRGKKSKTFKKVEKTRENEKGEEEKVKPSDVPTVNETKVSERWTLYHL